MQQSEPTPATDAVSAAMYEHFKTRAMTVNDIEGFLAHARQLERKARVMQRVLERIPSARRLIQVGFTNGTADVIWDRDRDPEHLLAGAILYVYEGQIK